MIIFFFLKKFDDYKRQRNKVTNLVRAAKKTYSKKLINHNKDTSSSWRTMNEITHKSRNKSVSGEIKGSPNSVDEHFCLFLSLFLNLLTTVSVKSMKFHHSLNSSVKIG